MSHFSCLAIVPSHFDVKGAEFHISAFCNGYIDGDYDENNENPLAFYDYAVSVPFPTWDEDGESEPNELPKFWVSTLFLKDNPFPYQVSGYEILEIRQLVKEEKISKRFLYEKMNTVYHPFKCNTIVSPTGLVYSWDDYENKEDFYTLCMEMYDRYSSGYIVYAFDCHS